MNKFKYIVLSAVCAISLNAMNLSEAINISIENNIDTKTSFYDYQDSKRVYDKSKASFMPKVDLSYSYNKRDKLITSQIKEDSTASATLSYNLFNGFNDLANLYSTKYSKMASKYYFEATKQDIILQTKSDYLNYLNMKKVLTTKEDAFKLFEKQYLDAKNQFMQGLISQNDLLKVEVNMLNAKQSVINAKGNLEVSKYQLSNTLGGYDLSNENIEEVTFLIDETKNFDEETLQNRSELKALKLISKSVKEQSFASKSSFMPTIDASLSYNEYGEDTSIGGRANYPENQEVLNVSASWNLFNGLSDYNEVKRKSIEVKKADLQIKKLMLDLNLQYKTAMSNYNVSKANYNTSKIALDQSKKNYEIVQNRYNEGLSDNTDLIDANYLLSLAKENFNKAYYDKYLSYETLKRVVEFK